MNQCIIVRSAVYQMQAGANDNCRLLLSLNRGTFSQEISFPPISGTLDREAAVDLEMCAEVRSALEMSAFRFNGLCELRFQFEVKCNRPLLAARKDFGLMLVDPNTYLGPLMSEQAPESAALVSSIPATLSFKLLKFGSKAPTVAESLLRDHVVDFIDNDECMGSLNLGDMQNILRFFPFYTDALSGHQGFPGYMRTMSSRFDCWRLIRYTETEMSFLQLPQSQYFGARAVSAKMQRREYMLGDNWREIIRHRAFEEIQLLLEDAESRNEMTTVNKRVRLAPSAQKRIFQSRSYQTLYAPSIVRTMQTASEKKSAEGNPLFLVLFHRLHPLTLYPYSVGSVTDAEFRCTLSPDIKRELSEEIESLVDEFLSSPTK